MSRIIIPINPPQKINLWEKQTKGFLIFATGNPYYSFMAIKLAVSMKFHEPETKILLVTEGEANNWAVKKYAYLFDKIIECPKEYLYVGDVRTDTKAKCFEDMLSPYDETIVIDADSIWLAKKKPSELFEKFKNIDFFQYSRNITDMSQEDVDTNSGSFWAKLSDIKKAFNIHSGYYYNCAGEFRYFKKSVATAQIYYHVCDIINNPRIEVIEFLGSKFNEELSFNIAITLSGYEMPFTDFKPTHWFGNDGAPNNKNYIDISNDYYILSVGGNFSIPATRQAYEMLASAYLGRFGITDIPAKLTDKRVAVPTRKTI